MTLNEAVRKAKENGWNDEECAPVVGSRDRFNYDRMLLDPKFFQSLGKALGWATQEFDGLYDHSAWKKNWHRFIDHLADGKSVESFFETLTL